MTSLASDESVATDKHRDEIIVVLLLAVLASAHVVRVADLNEVALLERL